ncbi:fic family toxin-antitoxin system, toxin component [Streptomyces sp. NPDC058045]|uniref:fic family toxin-antitoxin system, toxin component n=1 Tax=Streptomyces sp. NPDC058045 TaxID=3346311 RepID=UPI0036E58627
MNHPEPRRLDVPFLLHAAELLQGDPQVDDYGLLYAAVARVNAHALGRDVYGSPHLKAAALLHHLVRLPALEHSNSAFAWHSCEAYLSLQGLRLRYPPQDAVALVHDAAEAALGVPGIARRLRTWTT